MLPLTERLEKMRGSETPADVNGEARDFAPSAPPVIASAPADAMFRRVALAQGAYFAATGVWALFALGLFMRITGPKTDTWLVKTVGVLVTVIGVVLGMSANRPSRETAALGAGSAAALIAIDVTYVAKRRISPVYLLDAIAEVAIIAGWAAWFRRSGRRSR